MMKKAKKASAKKAPAKKASAKKTPVKKTPVKKTPVKKASAKKTPVKKKVGSAKAGMSLGAAPSSLPRIFAMPFASVYPAYVNKAERKGRTKDEVDQVIAWLTGYRGARLQRALDTKIDLETFFAKAPRMNPNVGLITGVVCGVRVEEIEHPLMQKIRYLDKLVDELAKGKKMESILRA